MYDDNHYDNFITLRVHNKDMLAFVFRQLSSLYHVLIAENGVEALDVLEQKSVDLIISDIMMPLMDGVELCKHLKTKSGL